MGCVTVIVGMIVPRLLILYSWATDPAAWSSSFSSQIWPILGFILLPWTTFFFVIFSAAGGDFDLFRILVMIVAVLADLATWGLGGFSSRKRVSNFRF